VIEHQVAPQDDSRSGAVAAFAGTAPEGFCCRAGWEESLAATHTASAPPEHCPRCHRADCITDHAMTDAANVRSSRGFTQIIRATWPADNSLFPASNDVH